MKRSESAIIVHSSKDLFETYKIENHSAIYQRI